MRVYFFCRVPGPPEAAGYKHGLVALAEGVTAVGHQFAGNRDQWPRGEGWLIPKTDEPARNFDLVLISNVSFNGPGSLLIEYLELDRGPRRVYVDQSDGWRTDASSNPVWPADLVLRAQYNRRFHYPTKVCPWAFGLTHRMIEATAGGAAARDRSPVILCDFRVGHPAWDLLTRNQKRSLGSRWQWDDRIDTKAPQDPAAYRLWALTGRWHNPANYERLKQAQAWLAFGGFFAPGFSGTPSTLLGRVGYKALQTLTQFDIWRFWEALASGALTVHAPLDAWGVVLPLMPQDGRDYVSYQPGEPAAEWESCLSADTGRRWAIENYGPEAAATHLLEML